MAKKTNPVNTSARTKAKSVPDLPTKTLSNLTKYKSDLDRLIQSGNVLDTAIQFECLPGSFEEHFQKMKLSAAKISEFKKEIPRFSEKYEDWYSESKSVIQQLLPERLNDFVTLYEKPRTRKEISFENYVVRDYLQGLSITRGYHKEKVVGPEAAIPQFRQQLNILKSVQGRFESSLFDIKQIVQADLFDSELDAARELLKNKFERAAGVISGVVLEKHLGQVCLAHSISAKKKDPGITDFNDLLKSTSVIDVPTWRFIQRLGDLRNICCHNKDRDPKNEEVEELIDGIDKITKSVF